jgi:hypothetical protein
VIANTYTHVLSDEEELDYDALIRARMVHAAPCAHQEAEIAG